MQGVDIVKEDTQSKCHHCGGVLTASEDIVSCLMCGRPVGHKCDLCINLPGRKSTVDIKRKAVKKGRRKKPAATR